MPFTSSGRSALRVLLLAALAMGAGLGGQSAARAEVNAPYAKVVGVRPGSALWIRAQPTRFSPKVGVLRPQARRIRVFRCERLATGEWCKVRFRGTRGWVSGRYLAADRARRS